MAEPSATAPSAAIRPAMPTRLWSSAGARRCRWPMATIEPTDETSRNGMVATAAVPKLVARPSATVASAATVRQPTNRRLGPKRRDSGPTITAAATADSSPTAMIAPTFPAGSPTWSRSSGTIRAYAPAPATLEATITSV